MVKRSLAVVILILSLIFLPLPAVALPSPDGVWEEIPTATRSSLSAGEEPWIKPEVFRLFRLDEPSLGNLLNQATSPTGEGASRTPLSALELTLPSPDGQFVTIVFTETPVMAPELAARFPEIKTYSGHIAGDPTATVVFDWTPMGFHAQVLAAEGPWYIDPFIPGESYASYHKRDYRSNKRFIDYPAIPEPGGRMSLAERTPLDATPVKSDKIRAYRLALGCTAEYAQYQCGGLCANKTKPIAAMATTILRVNQIYKREMAIEFILVGNNDKLVFLDPVTQPFTNGNTDRLLEQSQKIIDLEIGNAHYDIGHVISTSSGGLSMLGAVCQTGRKAMAVTGLDQPKGDAYDVDFVCHEMGHSFSADHTYNGKLGLCSTDQYAPLMAYEPGSGVTIMSYCGQCDDDSPQFSGEPTFHSGNFEQIQTYMAGKGSCYTLSQTANAAPVVQAFTDITIPRNTPFTLTGTATDADNDPLTYLWEEFDRGGVQASLSEADDGKMPLFRLYRPTTTGIRTFPKMETIAAGIADKTEKLPQLARTMHFRLTARDGRGGVAYGTQRILVDGGSGPLRVTAPAAGASVPSVPGGPLTLAVTWDVANTSTLPGATNVDILLSTDGGLSYPITLLAGTPNNGSASVTLPDIGTERARIMVRAADNIFFAVSGGDFKIAGPGGALSVTPAIGLVASGDEGGTFQNTSIVYRLRNTGASSLTWSATKTATWLNLSATSGTLSAGGNVEVSVFIDATAAKALGRDQYQDTIIFTNTTNGAGSTSRPALLIVGQTLKDGYIVLEAEGLDAWGITGGTFSPSSKTFTVRNVGLSEAAWTAAIQNADWITLTPVEGLLRAGESATITATVNNDTAKDMQAGIHAGTISFFRTLVQGSELLATRPLKLTIATPATTVTLAVTPAEGLAATGYRGGTFSPAGKNFTLRNTGQADLSWTAAKTAEWLTLAPAVGTLAKGESTVVTAFINSNAAALAAGAYNDTITFSNTTAGANGAGNTTRPVSLSIATGPGNLSVTAPTAFTYTGPRGGPFTPGAGVTCTLQNTGGAAIDWTVEVLETWLEATPQKGTLAAGGSVTVKISASDMARALIAGTFSNTIYFSNKTNGAGSMTLDGQITVAPTPATGPLTVSPASAVTVSGAKGGPFTPASFDFTLGNTGAEPLTWEYLGDSGWANAPATTSGTLAAGGSATFTMTMNGVAGLLSSNNYRGSVYFFDKTHKLTIGRFIDLKVRGPGDVNGDGKVDVADAVVSVQVKSGQAPSALRSDYAASGADVDGDNKVGHHEAVYTMQTAAELRPATPYFVLKSSAFRDEQPIPVKYLAHGLSPALSWSNAPAGTQSFVLIVEDPDEIPALGVTKNYWIVYDIPANVTALAEGAGAQAAKDGKNQLPAGAKHGTTSWDKENTYYHGLEPTANTGVHRFIFRLFALSVASISPAGGTTQDKIEAAMEGKVLAGGICELMGTAARP